MTPTPLRRSAPTLLVAGAAAALCALAAPPPLGAQDGTVRGQVFDSTTMSPLEGARVAILETTVKGTSGADGTFTLTGVPPGPRSVFFFHPRLRALGVSPPVTPVDVPESGQVDVFLALPSRETLVQAWCRLEGGAEGTAAVAGMVRDSVTGTPLPRAQVSLDIRDPATGRLVPRDVVRTDEQGRYRFCALPPGETVAIRPTFANSSGRAHVLRVGGGAVLRDLEMAISATGRLVGVVRDAASGAPVEGATVRAEGSGVERVTDAEGKFVLTELPPGWHLIRTEHLAYGPNSDTVTIFSNETVQVEMALSPEAIALEGLTVTGRARGTEIIPDLGRRGDRILRPRIEELLPRSSDVGDLLRYSNIPGLSVQERRVVEPTTGMTIPQLCVEELRRSSGPDECRMVAVYVDGIPVTQAGEFLRSLPPDAVESMEFLNAVDAGTRYGRQGANGVLLITTRR